MYHGGLVDFRPNPSQWYSGAANLLAEPERALRLLVALAGTAAPADGAAGFAAAARRAGGLDAEPAAAFRRAPALVPSVAALAPGADGGAAEQQQPALRAAAHLDASLRLMVDHQLRSVRERPAPRFKR